MNWIILIIAGFCECGFTFCLGKAKLATGWEQVWWYVGFGVISLLSMFLLAKATQGQHAIAIGTAYPVWTGIGALGTVLLGIFVFHEPATFWRIFFIFTLVASIIGLKLVGN